MKIYKYYIKRKNCPSIFNWKNRGNPDDYILYAFTTKKEFAERFEKERRMKIFYKKVDKEADKETLHEIKKMNRMSELILYDLIYFKSSSSKEKKETCYKEMLCTSSEREIIDTRNENPIIQEFEYINPAIFKDSVLNLLCKVQYVAGYRLWLQMNDSAYLNKMADLLDSRVENDYDMPMIHYDEVQIFVEYFGILF